MQVECELLRVILIFYFCHQNTTFQVGYNYYWREYRYEVPCDAVQVGKDYNGNPQYVGQVLIAGKLLVAEISGNDKVGLAFDNQTVGRPSHWHVMKILCSENRNRFYWIPTSKGDFEHFQNLVIGGMDCCKIFYIGRINYNMKISIGGVITFKKSGKCKGVRVIYNVNATVYDSFEVLAYRKDVDG